MEKRIYLCIDLKSFYASVECVERNLDSLKTKLVVADKERGNGTICLAVSPALKALGVKNRCRLFEVPTSIDFIIAKPRMSLYIKYSADIYGIYLKYIAKEDIYVYSIDECFLDVTSYLKLYNKTAKELAKIMIDDVYNTTGICATAGIGDNLFLAKVALDVVAKHVDDHIGILTNETFKDTMWHHRPITDIWQIGRGYASHLEKMGIYDLAGIVNYGKDKIVKEFGINGEILYDHAMGIEPTTIEQIHKYKPKSNSLSNGQVLFEDYNYIDARLVMKEMVDLQVREMVSKELACSSIGLVIRYSKEIKGASGKTLVLNEITNSYDKLIKYFEKMYDESVIKHYPIRGIMINFGGVVSDKYITFDLFSNPEHDKKENDLQKAMIDIQNKFGKNSVLKGMNFKEKSTTRTRNKLIGGHNAN